MGEPSTGGGMLRAICVLITHEAEAVRTLRRVLVKNRRPGDWPDSHQKECQSDLEKASVERELLEGQPSRRSSGP